MIANENGAGRVPRVLSMIVRSALILCLLALLLGPACQVVPGATYGQEVLAAVLLAEARGEGESGMLAVGEVIRHRADQRGVSLLAVLRPGAFSSLNGVTRDELLRRYKHHPQFPMALEIARTAYNQPDRLRNTTRDATHFTHKNEKPYWTSGHAPVATIGNHAFYRLPRF